MTKLTGPWTAGYQSLLANLMEVLVDQEIPGLSRLTGGLVIDMLIEVKDLATVTLMTHVEVAVAPIDMTMDIEEGRDNQGEIHGPTMDGISNGKMMQWGSIDAVAKSRILAIQRTIRVVVRAPSIVGILLLTHGDLWCLNTNLIRNIKSRVR